MPRIDMARQDGIAILTLNHPPINGFSRALRRDLLDALEQSLTDHVVAGIVITGFGNTFSRGADLHGLGQPDAEAFPSLIELIAALESSTKPVVAAINGTCLGEGLQFVLACHARAALGSVCVGMPDVMLGLLPRAGGTQRLPRAVGLELGLRMIGSGLTLRACDLAQTDLFDAVVARDVVQAATGLAQRLAASGEPLTRLRDRSVRPDGADALLRAARAHALARHPHEPAWLRCVEAVAASLGPFEAGLRFEREAFETLLSTPQSRSLRHAFLAERAASEIPDLPADTPLRPIATVGVVGAGTMGGGISMNLLNAGIPVTLVDSAQENLDRCLATIRRNYAVAVEKGRIEPAQAEACLAMLRPTLDFARLAEADLLIEAVFEDMEVKREVFARLDAIAKPGAILASNTSTLDLDALAASTQRAQEVVGLHFFSPAHVMRLLEVVRGKATAKDVLATVMQLSRTIHKTAVVSRVCDGFIGNRMLEHYVRMAHSLVEEGASPCQVDRALEAWGMAMGPFRMGDLAGNDIGWAVRKRRYVEKPQVKYSRLADRLCEFGRFGQKSGAGWYRYAPGAREALPDPAVDKLIANHRQAIGVVPHAIEDAEIVDRCIYALVNEGARILQEGIAQRASDIDTVYLAGYGFPAWRGGPMFFADTVGLATMIERMRQFALQPGGDIDFWQPATRLLELAEQGAAFNIQ